MSPQQGTSTVHSRKNSNHQKKDMYICTYARTHTRTQVLLALLCFPQGQVLSPLLGQFPQLPEWHSWNQVPTDYNLIQERNLLYLLTGVMMTGEWLIANLPTGPFFFTAWSFSNLLTTHAWLDHNFSALSTLAWNIRVGLWTLQGPISWLWV